jgi:hypothetical protein
MRIPKLAAFATATLIAVLALPAALRAGEAQQQAAAPAPNEEPFKALMARGLKIVSVVLVQADINRTNNSVVVVTMQLDKQIAVCTFAIAQWENMTQLIDDDAKACEIRNY